MLDRDAIDALANRLRPHYRHFLGPHEGQVLLTAHSHQAWPDVSREAHLAAWDDAAALIDDKWDHILGELLPGFQELVAQRLGSSRPADLAVAPNTHELVYRLASCFPADSAVVTTDAEFHSLRRQLARLAEDGLALHIVPTGDADADAAGFGDRFLAAVDRHRPAWAALSQVLFTNSRVVVELPRILAGLAERGVPVLVDVYHAFNVIDLRVDDWPGQVFVTGGGYKYAQSGEGACWMLLPADAERYRPRQTGWFADFDGLSQPETSGPVGYGAGGMRFLGSTFDASGLYRGIAVMRWMDEQGLSPALLQTHAQARTQLVVDGHERHGLAERGLRLASPRQASARGGFVAFECDRAGAVRDRLRALGVHTDVRGRLLRLGPAPYIGSADIDRAMDLLARVIADRET
ncbi:aminotransferase class V-fold PLP-dependent enzyme [Haliangium sp.]|uniref:kynureninase/PvdN C-terminal domain-containing protein n=1 Tax=Haliangium sp. TaxID=2663208 RepID=UPI003D14358E